MSGARSRAARDRQVRKLPPVAEPTTNYEPVTIKSHRELVAKKKEILRRLHEHPDAMRMLLINPVLAMKTFGVTFSPEMSRHVLHSIQHPPRLKKRREELDKKLTRELGEAPRPNDPQWVAELLFNKLQLEPLNTRGKEPAYQTPLSEGMIERLRERRRDRRKRPPKDPTSPGTVIKVAFQRPAVRRLDLDADLPPLAKARTIPKRISLEQLYFYKDSHPTARQVLELGIIQRRAWPIHSGAAYRKVQKGERRSALLGWIKSIRFPERRG